MFPDPFIGLDLIARHHAEMAVQIREHRMAACIGQSRSRYGRSALPLHLPAGARLALALDGAVARLRCRLGYC